MGLSLVSKFDAAGAACLDLGKFGLATNYAITGISGKVLTVAEDVSALLLDGMKIVIDTGTGAGEIYTLDGDAVYDTDHSDITVEETLGAVIVTDTLCRTAVPTAADDVEITHNIPGGAAIPFACKDLNLLSAVANFATSVAPAGTVSVTSTYTFTYGTKQVGIKSTGANLVFTLAADGSMNFSSIATLLGESCTLGDIAANEPWTVNSASDVLIHYSGDIKVGRIWPDGGGVLAYNAGAGKVTVKSGTLIAVAACAVPNTYVVYDAPIVRIGILPADIRNDVAGGTLKAGRVVSA